jgi:hypothetical protein
MYAKWRYAQGDRHATVEIRCAVRDAYDKAPKKAPVARARSDKLPGKALEPRSDLASVAAGVER